MGGPRGERKAEREVARVRLEGEGAGLAEVLRIAKLGLVVKEGIEEATGVGVRHCMRDTVAVRVER